MSDPTPNPPAAPELDPAKVEALRRRMEGEQNLPMGIVAGLVAALVGAAIWAMVTVATKYQIGFMAIGVGFLVGFAVRFMGKGISNTYGVIGAVFALLGCALGNLLAGCGFIAAEQSVSFWKVVASLDAELITQLMAAMFSPMDLLFYGIAVYCGFKYSFRQVKDGELNTLTKTDTPA